MKNSVNNLKKRGQIDEKFERRFSHQSTDELLELLADPDPQKRTVAATLLGKRREQCSIEKLGALMAGEEQL